MAQTEKKKKTPWGKILASTAAAGLGGYGLYRLLRGKRARSVAKPATRPAPTPAPTARPKAAKPPTRKPITQSWTERQMRAKTPEELAQVTREMRIARGQDPDKALKLNRKQKRAGETLNRRWNKLRKK